MFRNYLAAAPGVSPISIFLLLMLIGCGIYCIYTYIRLDKLYYLFPNKFLYPGNCHPEDCKDVDGFIDYILPRMLWFGIVLIVLGAAYGLVTFVLKISGNAVSIGSIVAPMGFFVWYMIVQRTCAKRYW